MILRLLTPHNVGLVTLHANFMLLLLSSVHVLSIALLRVLKVSSLKYRCLAKFGLEALHNCHMCLVWSISIIKMNVFRQEQLKQTFLFAQQSIWQPSGWPGFLKGPHWLALSVHIVPNLKCFLSQIYAAIFKTSLFIVHWNVWNFWLFFTQNVKSLIQRNRKI